MSEIEGIWQERQEQIERALNAGRDPIGLPRIKEMLENGEAQFWPYKDSSLITNLYTRGTTRYCQLWAAGGDLTELRELEAHITWWAREIDCDRVQITGRRGWLKVFTDYDEVATVMMKELDHE